MVYHHDGIDNKISGSKMEFGNYGLFSIVDQVVSVATVVS